MKKLFMGKNLYKTILGILGVIVLIIAFSYNSAAPGNILYGIDRGMESIALKLTKKPDKLVKLYLSYATERLEELKMTTRDTAETKELIQDYNFDLDQIVNNINSMIGNKSYTDQQVADLIRDLVEVRTVSFGRTLNLRIQSTSVKSVKNEINRGIRATNSFIFQVFDIGIKKVKGDYKFEIFVKNMVDLKNQQTSQDVKFMEENLTLLSPQITPDELKELTSILEDIRQRYFTVRSEIGKKSSLESYTELQTIEDDINTKFDPKLIEISQSKLVKNPKTLTATLTPQSTK